MNGNEVRLTWNASTDNVAVVEYVVYRSTILNIQGPEVGRSPTNKFTDRPPGGVTYWYTARARDTFYTSWRSNFASITVPATTNAVP